MNLSIQRTSGPDLKRRIRLSQPIEDAIMKACLKQSPIVWEASIDGEGACIWGMIPTSLMSDRTYIWLYTTDVADKHAFVLVRQSKIMLEEMLKEFPLLYGYCKYDDLRAIRWMRWLGAKMDIVDDFGRIPFSIKAEKSWTR